MKRRVANSQLLSGFLTLSCYPNTFPGKLEERNWRQSRSVIKQNYLAVCRTKSIFCQHGELRLRRDCRLATLLDSSLWLQPPPSPLPRHAVHHTSHSSQSWQLRHTVDGCGALNLASCCVSVRRSSRSENEEVVIDISLEEITCPQGPHLHCPSALWPGHHLTHGAVE